MRTVILGTLLLLLVVSAWCSSLFATEPYSLSFGGYYTWSSTGDCIHPHANPCLCPNGFRADIGTPTNGDFVVLCYGNITESSAFQGTFAKQADGTCLTPNLATGACSCPTTAARNVTFADSTPVVTFCLGATRDAAFSGAYDSATANPLLNNTHACPAHGESFTFASNIQVCGLDCAAADGNETACAAAGEYACTWCPTQPTGLCLPANPPNANPPTNPVCCTTTNTTGFWCGAYDYYSTCCEKGGECCEFDVQETTAEVGCCPPGTSCCTSTSVWNGYMLCCHANQTCSSEADWAGCYAGCEQPCHSDKDCNPLYGQTDCKKCIEGRCRR